MTEPDNLSQRVDALEDHATARTDAAAARTLAAAADRDVSEVRAELRAHIASLNALRETQIQQGRVLNQHSQILDEHSRVLGTLKKGVTRILELLTEERGST